MYSYVVVVSDNNFSVALGPKGVRNASADELIWSETGDHANRKMKKTQMIVFVGGVDLSVTRLTTKEDNHSLTADNDQQDTDEESAVHDAFEDVQADVEAAIVDGVGNLYPNEGVQAQGGHLVLLVLALVTNDGLA